MKKRLVQDSGSEMKLLASNVKDSSEKKKLTELGFAFTSSNYLVILLKHNIK